MAKDILLGEDGDLSFVNGDITVEYSDEQHIEHILTSGKGQYKNAPYTGVNIKAYDKGSLTGIERLKLEQEVNIQLESDEASEIDVVYNTEGVLKIQANYGD